MIIINYPHTHTDKHSYIYIYIHIHISAYRCIYAHIHDIYVKTHVLSSFIFFLTCFSSYARQEMIPKMVAAGTDIFRLNCSHRRGGDFERVYPLIRKAAQELGRKAGMGVGGSSRLVT